MRNYVYVVAEMHNSPYLEEQHLFETEFATKKEALKAFSKTCRNAKEESAMAPVAGEGIPNSQPIYVALQKMTKDGYEDIASAYYVGGLKCWSRKGRC